MGKKSRQVRTGGKNNIRIQPDSGKLAFQRQSVCGAIGEPRNVTWEESTSNIPKKELHWIKRFFQSSSLPSLSDVLNP